MIFHQRKRQGLEDQFKGHIGMLEEIVGRINDISVATGGLVNYVYRVEGERGTLYLKVRKTEFSALPLLNSNPADIRYESKALDILSSAFPEVFPNQVAFYPKESMMVLSDAIGNGVRLDEAFRRGTFSEESSASLGSLVGRIHTKFRDADISIREDGDEEYHTKNLEYRLGYHKNHELDSLVSRLKQGPRQLILGDLSPKNMGVGPDGKFTMWDLEIAHRGNPVFDVGFLAAHVVLHSRDGTEKPGRLLKALLDGYYSTADKVGVDGIDLKQIVLGIILFRMRNEVIPYMMEVAAEDRNRISDSASLLLLQRDPSWLEIARCVA